MAIRAPEIPYTPAAETGGGGAVPGAPAPGAGALAGAGFFRECPCCWLLLALLLVLIFRTLTRRTP